MATAHARVLSPSTSKDEALAWLVAGEITVEDFKRWDASKSVQSPLRCKVSEKGALSVYGLSAKWPTTLYIGQWERLIDYLPQLLEFAKANNAKLSRKS